MTRLFAALLLIPVLIVCASFLPADPPIPQSTVKVMVGDTHCSGVHLGHGVVLTASHCTELGTHDIIVDDGMKYPARLLWQSHEYDIALIHAALGDDHIAASELFCDMAAVGQEIVAAGHPVDMEWIRTRGVIVGKQIDRSALAEGIWPETITADVTVGPGNSGGPIFDTLGRVIGIVVGLYPRAQGLIIIVPTPTICRLMARA